MILETRISKEEIIFLKENQIFRFGQFGPLKGLGLKSFGLWPSFPNL
jgi:hypothetical protein